HLPGASYARRILRNPKIVIRTNSISAKLAAARSGLAIAHLPRYVAQVEPNLVQVDLGAPPFKRPMWLVMHADVRDIPRIRATADFLAEAIIKRRKQLA
ncbi:MAG: substrate-binding domain-containing protein, partial [Hyphomicrobiales bacterium]|nr:substrate-binding domain-containing protein [Hyphomicrobiales bacterium]